MINKGRPWFFKSYLRFKNDVVLPIVGTGVPVDGTSGTGVGYAGPGSIYVNYSTGYHYRNQNTKASPTWALVDAGSAPGLIALASGHVLVGTGGGIAADVALSGDATMANTGAMTVATVGTATAAEVGKLAGVVAGTATASKALVVDANRDLDAPALRSRILGVGNNYKIARGVHQQVAASDTVATGLTTVVAVVVSFRDTPTVKQLYCYGSIGDQAGAPAAGSILILTKKPTANNDVTPTASTDFTDNINFNWIAVGV